MKIMDVKTIQMRIFFTLLTIIIFLSPLKAMDRPKVGLVLSGGGARGFAHIGTLKMLDSLQIPVDYIAGTSMGGIIGALYAIGYSGNEIEQIILKTDWREIFTDNPKRNNLPYFQKKETGKYQMEFGLHGLRPKAPSGLIYGQKISLLFSGLTFPYESITDFKQLPIPFHCVAVNIETGSQVILKSGSLAKAMRATMAIPSAFSPVEWGDSLLIDGGMVNNLPVDVVKEMGAELVIAVDVGVPLMKRDKLNSAVAVLEQSIAMLGIERWKENVKLTDVYIQPELNHYTVADFDNEKVRDILHCGDQCAELYRNSLDSLKTTHQLQRLMNTQQSPYFPKQTHIQEIQISGYTGTKLESIQESLKLHVDEIFDYKNIIDQIADVETKFGFRSVNYEIIPMSQDSVRLMIRIQERQQPIIFGITITGNETLPFSYIYQLLGFKPNDSLDIDMLNRRIMEMYGLGYFENLRYEIKPRGDGRVHLFLHVKELEKRKLRLGLRYDDKFKLVAIIAIQGTNFLIPGLRYEHELQMAGLMQYYFKTYYPSRTLNMPIYPYFRFQTKNIPIHIYDGYSGVQIAEYKDKSIRFSAGFGFLLGKSLNIEVEYQVENMDIIPSVAFHDPTLFPQWDEKLRKLTASLIFDRLDDLITPSYGIYFQAGYEGSYKQFHSEWPYEFYRFNADAYYTIFNRYTFRFYGFKGWGFPLPIYKFHNQGHPATFVGMDYDQLYGTHISILRTDYRYRISSGIYLKLMINKAFDLKQASYEYYVTPDDVWGYGVGLKLVTPIGPIEFIYGRGDKNFSGRGEKQNVFYFLFGSNIERHLYH